MGRPKKVKEEKKKEKKSKAKKEKVAKLSKRDVMQNDLLDAVRIYKIALLEELFHSTSSKKEKYYKQLLKASSKLSKLEDAFESKFKTILDYDVLLKPYTNISIEDSTKIAIVSRDLKELSLKLKDAQDKEFELRSSNKDKSDKEFSKIESLSEKILKLEIEYFKLQGVAYAL